jgi:hypothetical protein
MDELARQAHTTIDMQKAKAANFGDVLTKAAMQLRNEGKKCKMRVNHAPSDTDQNAIPASLTHFLHTVLTGECECQTSSERVQSLATSFGMT